MSGSRLTCRKIACGLVRPRREELPAVAAIARGLDSQVPHSTSRVEADRVRDMRGHGLGLQSFTDHTSQTDHQRAPECRCAWKCLDNQRVTRWIDDSQMIQAAARRSEIDNLGDSRAADA